MKRIISVLSALFLLLQLYGQPAYRKSDLSAGSFKLQNGKVHFEKIYQSPMSMEYLSEKLHSMNNPSSGLQVKKSTKDGMNGVIIKYQLDWTTTGFKKKRIPDFLKLPINANFEVVKDGLNYRVRITDVWFTNLAKPVSQQHLTLEQMVVTKKGLAFTRDKKVMRALSILDENLAEVFRGKPSSF